MKNIYLLIGEADNIQWIYHRAFPSYQLAEKQQQILTHAVNDYQNHHDIKKWLKIILKLDPDYLDSNSTRYFIKELKI